MTPTTTATSTQVTFRGLPHSEALEAQIHERVDWVRRFHPDLLACHVLVEVPHRHAQRGRPFHVRVEATIAGRRPIVITRQPTRYASLVDNGQDGRRKNDDAAGEYGDAPVVVRNVFAALRRRLQDFTTERIERRRHPVAEAS